MQANDGNKTQRGKDSEPRQSSVLATRRRLPGASSPPESLPPPLALSSSLLSVWFSWLVVWGGVFGGVIGGISTLVV